MLKNPVKSRREWGGGGKTLDNFFFFLVYSIDNLEAFKKVYKLWFVAPSYSIYGAFCALRIKT